VRLRLGQEQREIRSALRLASDRDSIEFPERFAVRPADLTQALHDVRPHILHFSGHGSRSGDLCFENDAGASQAVDPEALASLFQLISQDVEAVVLNACYSQSQALAIGRSIQYVIGMAAAITDKAAIRFSTGFYKALVAGYTYPKSFDFGVTEVQLHGMPDYLTPVLHLKPMPGPSHIRTNDDIDETVYAKFSITKQRWGETGLPVHVDTTRFHSVRSLIETLYQAYLMDQVPPFTYGTEWIITGHWNHHHLLVPGAWVKASDAPAHSVAASWDDMLGLDDVGIIPGSRWIIRLRNDHDPLTKKPFAAASSDPIVRRVLRRHPKGFFALEGRFVEAETAGQLEVNSAVPVVLEDWTNSGLGGRWFIDKGGEIPERARYYLDLDYLDLD
jgi:CHAT domain-containing protein